MDKKKKLIVGEKTITYDYTTLKQQRRFNTSLQKSLTQMNKSLFRDRAFKKKCRIYSEELEEPLFAGIIHQHEIALECIKILNSEFIIADKSKYKSYLRVVYSIVCSSNEHMQKIKNQRDNQNLIKENNNE